VTVELRRAARRRRRPCGRVERVSRGREREIVTINFPLMGVQHRNEVVREDRGECRERSHSR